MIFFLSWGLSFTYTSSIMFGAKRRKVAHDAPKKKKQVVAEKPPRAEPEPSKEEQSEEESATLEEPSAEEAVEDAPKKTFKDLVCPDNY